MEGMDDDGSGYEAGSSDNALPSSSSEISLSEKKKPCEVCGSNADDDEIMTCFSCQDTREHRYCAKVLLEKVPPMWLCEICRFSSRVVVVVGRKSKETANSGPNHADNDEDSAASRRNRVDNQNTLSEVSATNQPLQAQAHTSRVASSPVRDQIQSDSNMASDSESAK